MLTVSGVLIKALKHKANRRATQVGSFEVCVLTYVALRMFIMQALASQLHFLANRNAELAVPPFNSKFIESIKIKHAQYLGFLIQLNFPHWVV